MEFIKYAILTAIAGIVGFCVGYSYGEQHATIVALKAQWERDAKEWDERIRELEMSDDY